MTKTDFWDMTTLNSMAQFALTVLAGVFALGLLLRPYQDLPERVEVLEESGRTLETRMIQQERKLDLVICFLEMDANGMNPLACSR